MAGTGKPAAPLGRGPAAEQRSAVPAEAHKAEGPGLAAVLGVLDDALGGRGEADDAALLQPADDPLGERGAMERIWKEREKQIERVLFNTAGMYGEVRGILGTSAPPVPALDLVPGLIEDLSAEAAG